MTNPGRKVGRSAIIQTKRDMTVRSLLTHFFFLRLLGKEMLMGKTGSKRGRAYGSSVVTAPYVKTSAGVTPKINDLQGFSKETIISPNMISTTFGAKSTCGILTGALHSAKAAPVSSSSSSHIVLFLPYYPTGRDHRPSFRGLFGQTLTSSRLSNSGQVFWRLYTHVPCTAPIRPDRTKAQWRHDEKQVIRTALFRAD